MIRINRQLVSTVLMLVGVLVVGLSAVQIWGPDIWYWWQGQRQMEYSLDATSDSDSVTVISPVSTDFGLIIAKINVNERVAADINPYRASEYLPILRDYGVAEAEGSVAPGQVGTTYLFGHSAINIWQITSERAPFTLLDKLELGDELTVFYKEQRYDYRVTDRKVVSPREVHYLTDKREKPTLIVQTCDPPGENSKRLLVIAELEETTED